MTLTREINQLIILIVSGRQAGDLMQQLIQNHFYFTKIDSSGGVFQEPTVCILIGLNNTRMASLMMSLNACCKTYHEYIPAQMNLNPGYTPISMIEAQVGGALVYTLNIERFIQI